MGSRHRSGAPANVFANTTSETAVAIRPARTRRRATLAFRQEETMTIVAAQMLIPIQATSTLPRPTRAVW